MRVRRPITGEELLKKRKGQKKDFIQKEKRQTEFIYSINKTLLY